MRTAKKLILLLSFILALGCNKKEDSSEPVFKLATADEISDDEYQIYSLIAKDLFDSNNLIIHQRTSRNTPFSVDDRYFKTIKTENPDLNSEVFADFIEKNDTVYTLGKKIICPAKSVMLISNEEIKHIFSTQDINNDWGKFHKKYSRSNGFIGFTRLGFDAYKTQGIIETGHYYASLGAEGVLVYVVKENNSWKIKKVINLWVS